jgi:signal transduction histidine kinase/ligand-binding sensor domain-containing protein
MASAQSRTLVEPPEFVLTQWTTSEGLPQNSVTAIAQTPDGYLWIGTFGGLSRFDGTSFRLTARVDSAGQHTDRILSLAVGPDSALWIGTEAGLLRYRNGSFDAYSTADGLPDEQVSALYVDGAGVVWIGTARGVVARHADGRFEGVRDDDARALPHVFSLLGDAEGAVWVNVADRSARIGRDAPGVARWRDTPARGAPAAIQMILHDRAGAHWFSRADGLLRVHADTVRTYGRARGVPGRATMVEDGGGGYWLGTANDGLFFLQPDHAGRIVRQYALPDGRRRYRIRSAFVDREGNVWFGTDANGLLLAKRNLFTAYAAEHGLSHDVPTAVYGDASGSVWVGTNCGGLNAIDPDRRSLRVFKPRMPNDPAGDPCVFSLTESPAGTIWAGSWGGGLTRIAKATGREERLGSAGLRDSVVLALFTDRSGTVWVGMNTGGLAALEDGRVRAAYTTADGLAHNSVRTIHQTRDGALWIGTLGGLSRFVGGRFTTFGAARGLSALHVRAIHEDAEGDLWIGTYGGGLNRLRGDTLRPIRQQDGLAEDAVSSILEDDRGRLWMSGNLGISRVARRELVAFTEGRAPRVHSVLYGTADGLQIAETNGGFQPAAWKDARGRFWYPTVRGVAVIDPMRTLVTEAPPSVAVEAVVVDGQVRRARDAIVVGPGRSNIEFRYTGLSLAAPQHITFRYRLEAFDDDWVEAGTRRVAYYPRLAPGSYRFVVSAANRDGVWNEAGTAIALRVVGPFWSAWWFRATVFIALVALVLAFAWRRSLLARRWRAAQEEFSRRLLESQEHERKRVAGELHDGLGQELLVIKNRAQLALRTGAPPAVLEQLEQISAVASQSLEGVRGLAHNLTPYLLDHLGLSAALRTMIDAAADSAAMSFRTTIENIDGLLPVEGEIGLFRIVQEGVNNVVRHSGATMVAVHARRAGDAIAVMIRDDGRGFTVRRDGAGRPAGGFGLSGIAERARILGGRVDVVSAPGEGTRLELSVPVPAGIAR